jgi:hypothetical protein
MLLAGAHGRAADLALGPSDKPLLDLWIRHLQFNNSTDFLTRVSRLSTVSPTLAVFALLPTSALEWFRREKLLHFPSFPAVE